MSTGCRKQFVVATAMLLTMAIAFLPNPARGASPSYYIETLGGRAKLVNGTISGLLDAYGIFDQAIVDSGANSDPAINAYYAVARMANILFRVDGAGESLIKLLHQYGYTLSGDDLGELDLLAPLDHVDNILLPENAPSLETLRTFLATPLITEIDGALGNLGVIADSFKEIIPASEINGDVNVEIDYGDILLFRAILKALKAAILTATAYDINLDPHLLVTAINADVFNMKRLLDYYPNLLNLLTTTTPTGAVQLDDAKNALIDFITDYVAASDHIRTDTDTTVGAEEFIAFDDCQLREEQFFRNMLSELQRSLQATQPADQVANLLVDQEERWSIQDNQDPNKTMMVELWTDGGEFWSPWPNRFVAYWGEADCIIENGSTTLYLEFHDWVDGLPCHGEASLTATDINGTTVSGSYSVEYYGSTPNCTGTASGDFSGTREVREVHLNTDLNKLFDEKPDLRALLPDFDTYGEPLPGTMGHGLGDDPTLGGILISLEEDGETTPFDQNFWTRALGLQPSGIVQIQEVGDGAISVQDGSVSDWGVISPVLQDVSGDEEWDDPVADMAALYLAKDSTYLYIRMTFHDGPVNHDPTVVYYFGIKPHYNAPYFNDITAEVGWDPSAQGGAGGWRVQVIRWSDDSIPFNQESGYVQAVDNDLEWKVPLSAMENLNGGFIMASTAETWGEDIDHNQTRLIIGPVATIGGEITGPFTAQKGVLSVAICRYDLPIEPEYIITLISYLGTEITNPLSYELEGVPTNVPLLIMARWEEQPNGIDQVGDLWGGYTEDPDNYPVTPKVITTSPTENLDITLSESYPMQISGTVTYTHNESGNRNLIIWGSTDPGFSTHEILFSKSVPPGTNATTMYGLNDLQFTRYFLYYFIDIDGNGQPDLGEPFAYQGYRPPGPDLGYDFVSLLDLEALSEYTGVNAVLHPASLDPTSFNVYHEQRPDAPYLIVAYTPYAPFPLISSVLVNGDNLLSTVDITGATDDWHEYWGMIPAGSFTGGVIPIGEHTYTITVQTTDGTTRQYSNTPNIDPMNFVTQVTPADWATVSTTPTFQWNSVTGAVRYRLEIANGKGYWVYMAYIDAPTTTHTVPAGKILPGKTYSWRITAYGPDGTDGTYDNRSRSVWRNFTVIPETVTISGQILNHTGGPLQGAKVEALLGGNIIASAVTGASGGYDLSVPVGYQYTIRVAAAGYARVSAETAGVVSGDLQDFDLGFSLADVDNTPPSIANLDPPDGSTVSTGQPVISASLSDDLAGIDPENIVFTLDGAQISFAYNEIDGRVSFTPVVNLANGSHTVTVDVQDYAQNPATQAAWSFTVDVQVAGDLNCDLGIDLADAIIALQVLTGNPPQSFCFSDVDGDGKTGLAEALYVLQKVAGFRDYEITSTYVQYRRYGDGSERRQIWIEVKDLAGNPSGDVLSYGEMKDPNGQLVEISSVGFEPSVDYVARYNSATGGWDEDLSGKPASGYWGRLNTTFLQPGDYTFTVVTDDGETLAPFIYNFGGEYLSLPVVDSSTIDWSWNGDGSLTINWTLPTQVAPPNLDPAEWHVDVYIAVNQGGSGTGHAYFGKVPLDLAPQHVDLSPAMAAKLKSLGNELRCWVRIRKNDNSYRSYSNPVTLWP